MREGVRGSGEGAIPNESPERGRSAIEPSLRGTAPDATCGHVRGMPRFRRRATTPGPRFVFGGFHYPKIPGGLLFFPPPTA